MIFSYELLSLAIALGAQELIRVWVDAMAVLSVLLVFNLLRLVYLSNGLPLTAFLLCFEFIIIILCTFYEGHPINRADY